jgi:transposase
MRRDASSPRQGYTSWSYQKALEEGLLPQYQPGQPFLQDNSRVHTAKATKLWLERHSIWTLEHPPHPPDLNPIEHLWWALKIAIYQAHPEFNTLEDSQEQWDNFCAALQEVWLTIPNKLIRSCIYSTDRRLESVEKAHGYQTRY